MPNLVEILNKSGKYTTLCNALGQVDLLETLQADGPFTVFAPTDEAFDKIPEEELQNIIDDEDLLENLLMFHVLAGKLTAAELLDVSTIESISGSEISLTNQDGNLIAQGAKVTDSDIEADNGVIHSIDSVLIPTIPST